MHARSQELRGGVGLAAPENHLKPGSSSSSRAGGSGGDGLGVPGLGTAMRWHGQRLGVPGVSHHQMPGLGHGFLAPCSSLPSLWVLCLKSSVNEALGSK